MHNHGVQHQPAHAEVGLPCSSGMLVCPEARLTPPQTIKLPGNDRKDLAGRTLWSQGFFSLRHGDQSQTMHRDTLPEGGKEEEENVEKSAASNQSSFKTASMWTDE